MDSDKELDIKDDVLNISEFKELLSKYRHYNRNNVYVINLVVGYSVLFVYVFLFFVAFLSSIIAIYLGSTFMSLLFLVSYICFCFFSDFADILKRTLSVISEITNGTSWQELLMFFRVSNFKKFLRVMRLLRTSEKISKISEKRERKEFLDFMDLVPYIYYDELMSCLYHYKKNHEFYNKNYDLGLLSKAEMANLTGLLALSNNLDEEELGYYLDIKREIEELEKESEDKLIIIENELLRENDLVIYFV